MTVSNLHAALLEAITVRQERAKAAMPEPWITVSGCVCTSCLFIAAESPDAVLRQCERDLKVLTRHQAIHMAPPVACQQCSRLDLPRSHSAQYDVEWPCTEITDLAAAYLVLSSRPAPQGD